MRLACQRTFALAALVLLAAAAARAEGEPDELPGMDPDDTIEVTVEVAVSLWGEPGPAGTMSFSWSGKIHRIGPGGGFDYRAPPSSKPSAVNAGGAMAPPFNIDVGFSRHDTGETSFGVFLYGRCPRDGNRAELGVRTEESDEGSPFTLAEDGLPEDFERSFTFHVQAGQCDFAGDAVAQVTLGRKGRNAPKLALDGCADLVPGKTARVTARAEPGGGSFRWWTEPSQVLAVQGAGSAVTLRGQAPGRTTLHAEYTAPGGKKVEASRPASCVKLVSVNGGAPLPEVVQWEDEGRFDPSWARKVPLEVEPAGGGDLVRFSVADPSLLTALAEARSLVLQGIRDGETTIQARTACGEKLGAALAVSVARCRKDYVARLRREMDLLKKGSEEINKRLGEVLDDPKFQEAANEIGWDTAELAWETGKAIVSAGGAGALGTKLDRGAEALAGVLEVVDGALKALQGQDVELGVDAALKKAKAATAAAIKDLVGAVGAANKFGDHLGRLIATADLVEVLGEQQEHNTRLFKEVVDKLDRCKGERGQEPGGPGPKRPRRPPKGPKPSDPGGGPSAPGGAGEAEGGAKPPGGEPPPPPPPQPPPRPPPQRPGLPLPPEQEKQVLTLLAGRGCGGKDVVFEVRSASSAAARFRDLEKAMTSFRDGPLARFRGSLGRLEGAIQRAESTSGAPAAQRRQALGFLAPELEGIVPEAKAFAREGDAFLDVVGGCDRMFPPMIAAVRTSARAP